MVAETSALWGQEPSEVSRFSSTSQSQAERTLSSRGESPLTLVLPLGLGFSPPLKAGSRISAVLGSKRHLFPYGKEMANPRHGMDFLDGSAGGRFFLGGADLFCWR